MTELLTAAQMRALEQAAIDSGEVTGLELMERAGQGVVEAIFEEWPELAKTSHRAVVLCGPGNNGGDGFVVARLLKEWGWEVEVFLYGDAEKLPADARVNYERWVEIGSVLRLDFNGMVDALNGSLPRYDDTILVDSLFGIGLTREIIGDLDQIFEVLSWHRNLQRIAVDLPSGLCANSGKELGVAIDADLTVTFQTPKHGNFLGSGPEICGKTVVVDIGLRSKHISKKMANSASRKLEAVNISQSRWQKTSQTHKFSHGHAIIASGPATKTGAVRLAARGALRIGAGLVTVASPSDALQENAAHLTAIMLRETDSMDQFKSLLSDDRISSICIGPGFARESESGGLDFEHTRKMVEAALSADKSSVLDADALSAFKDTPDDLFNHLHENCILTPHEGEFKRLFPDIHAKLVAPASIGPVYSKVDATRDAAARAGCVVLFKGADTVIAAPDGRAAINSAHYDRAAPWLATAGSGDVLAGFITGLLARGLSPMQAAETAAYLHVECALKFGPGLIAEDIPEQLPAIFADLGL